MTDKQKKIVFVLSYILVFVIGMMFGAIKKDDTVQSYSNQSVITKAQTTTQPTNEITLTAELIKVENKIKMEVITNLENGAIVEVLVLNNELESMSDFLTVQDGKASIEFVIPNERVASVYAGTALVRFNLADHPQPETIKNIYGAKGENLTGSSIKDASDGGKFVSVDTLQLYYPDEATVFRALAQKKIDAYKEKTYSSKGPDVIQDINLPDSISILTLTHSGTGNFIVNLHSGNDNDLIVNEIGNFSGRIPIFGEGPFTLEVNGSDTWTAVFSPLFATNDSSFAGTGFDVSNYFSEISNNVWNISHKGESNFIVYLHTDKGSKLIQNEIGDVESTVILDIPNGATTFMWEVQTNGEWSITPKD